jgi:hypothetical protein
MTVHASRNDFMKTSASALLPAIVVTLGALGGCEWIAGIENTTIGLDAMPPADAALPADASMTGPDGSGGAPDGGGDSPDAAICTGACIDDDAFEDFDGLQGGTNGRWRYVEVLPDGYADMTSFTFPEAVTGFIGTGTPAPGLAYCATNVTMPPCLDLQRWLALTTTAPGAHHPALTWIAPYDGVYVVDITHATAPGAPDIPAAVMLAHNDPSNILDSQPLATPSGALYAEVSVTAGDVLMVGVITESETSVSVGVSVVIGGPY